MEQAFWIVGAIFFHAWLTAKDDTASVIGLVLGLMSWVFAFFLVVSG